VHPVTDTLHGVAIADPYRWLEDQNSPETRAWLDAQIQYTQTFLSRIPVRGKVKQRLTELSRIDSYGLRAWRAKHRQGASMFEGATRRWGDAAILYWAGRRIGAAFFSTILG
jgi:prolyl oligopeptidase